MSRQGDRKIINEMCKHLGITSAELALYNTLLKRKDAGLNEEEAKDFHRLCVLIFRTLSRRDFTKRSCADQDFVLGMHRSNGTVESRPVYPLQELRSSLTELYSDFA